jgi:predicted amidophosphoribosyltransferase
MTMTAVTVKPMKLPAQPWVEAYVLDYHTVSSTPTGDPYYRFDTKRTELGELLFRLKYRPFEDAVLNDIVDTVVKFLGTWQPPIDCIVSAPPSLARKTQPILTIARAVGVRLGFPVCEGAVVKAKPTPQMKNVDDWTERQKLLADSIQPGLGKVKGKVILLLDDLIESGSTLRCTADVLLKRCGAKALYALVLTRTK